MMSAVQDRTNEFRSILAQAQKRISATKGHQRQALLSDAQRNGQEGPVKKTQFGRNAVAIRRGIEKTTERLQRLAQLAKQRSLFDDRPLEIGQLTHLIRQDLATLNSQIASLQSATESQHPKSKRNLKDQEGVHNDNVVVMLQSKLAHVGTNFRDVLEVRTKNMKESRSRKENFFSSVSSTSHPVLERQRSQSPLYQPSRGAATPQNNASSNKLAIDEPSESSNVLRPSPPQDDQQLLLMEEAQTQTQSSSNSYIQARGEAIDTIERTINELGGIFSQLATMVGEQSEVLQRIDAHTEEVVDHVHGAHRELMKYWSRVSGNRWLIAKMFGVLMIFFLLWVLISG